MQDEPRRGVIGIHKGPADTLIHDASEVFRVQFLGCWLWNRLRRSVGRT